LIVDKRVLQGALWAAFAALAVSIGVLFLAACDLGIKPLFGLRYCAFGAAANGLTAERERERDLRVRLHEAELRIAQLPACSQNVPPPLPAPAPPAPEPVPPAPESSPASPPPPPPEPPKQDQLKIPTRLDELRGCWQSVRGDLDIVSDDAEQRPIGKVRKCFCFGANGRGKARWLFTDGRTCETGLRAQLRPGELAIQHTGAPCSDGSRNVPEAIACRAEESGAATCDVQSLGKMRTRTTNEKYTRVSDAHCNWRPSR
jgi:hypothetical protein